MQISDAWMRGRNVCQGCWGVTGQLRAGEGQVSSGRTESPLEPCGERNEDASARRRPGRGCRRRGWSLRGCPGSRNEEQRKQGQGAGGVAPRGLMGSALGGPVMKDAPCPIGMDLGTEMEASLVGDPDMKRWKGVRATEELSLEMSLMKAGLFSLPTAEAQMT